MLEYVAVEERLSAKILHWHEHPDLSHERHIYRVLPRRGFGIDLVVLALPSPDFQYLRGVRVLVERVVHRAYVHYVPHLVRPDPGGQHIGVDLEVLEVDVPPLVRHNEIQPPRRERGYVDVGVEPPRLAVYHHGKGVLLSLPLADNGHKGPFLHGVHPPIVRKG